MSTPDGKQTALLATSRRVIYFLHDIIRNYLRKFFHLLFKPKSYARTIKIGDEKDFFDSLNFFLVSISFYLTVCSIFLLVDSENLLLANRASDIIKTAQMILSAIFIGISCFFVIRFFYRSSINFTNFMHCWFHVCVAAIILGIVDLIIVDIYLPPVSGYSEQFLNYLASEDYYGQADLARCGQDPSYYLCRSVGTIGSWVTHIVRFAYKVNLMDKDDPVTFIAILDYTSKFYFITFTLINMVLIGWIVHVQAIIQKYTLKVSYIASLSVILYFNILLAVLILAFPDLGDLFGVVVPGKS